MACQGNMPSFKYVTVENLVITYNSTPYPIKTFVTNKKYIIWKIDKPYQLEDSNVRPESSLLEYLIVINDNGKPTIVEHSELLYSFDQTTNGSNLTTSGDYNALKTKVEDNITKFNLLTNTVDGMTQIIGTTEELEDGTIIYNLNKVKADSESYGISISEIKTKIDDKYLEIKPIILNDLVEYLRTVSEYKLSFTDILEDTAITTEEKTLTTTQKTNMVSALSKLQETLSALKVIIDSVNDTEKSKVIADAKTKLTTLHDSLISICTTALLDNKISGEEKTNIIQKSYELTTYIGTVQNTCNNITVNGQAGVIYSIENELLMLKDRTTSTIKELSRDTSELGETVKTHTSEISQMKDDIKLKVEASDVTQAISNIEIGGRNLLRNTTSEYVDYSTGQYYINIGGGTSTLSSLGLKAGDTVTLRIYIKATGNKGATARISHYYGDGSSYATSLGNIISVGNEGYSTVTTTLRSDAHEKGIFVGINSENNSTNISATGKYKKAKLEKGNKATDFTIAPEDMDAIITNVKTQVSELEIDLDGITSRVGTTESLSITNFNNLLINSNIKNSTSGWRLTNLVEGESLNRGITSAQIPDRNAIMIGNLNDLTVQTRVMDSTKFEVTPGEKISMSLHGMETAYVGYLRVYMLYTDNTSPIETDNTFFDGYDWIELDSTSWKKYTLTTTVPAGATRGFIRIRYTSQEKPTAADNNRTALASIMVNRGDVFATWTQNTEDNYSYQETRIKAAEQKITDESITNTVKKSFYTKEETNEVVTSKGYQTSSQVQQTVDALQLKFQESGGYNLLYNGNFKRDIEMWSLSSGFSYAVGSGTWASPDKSGVRIDGKTASDGYLTQSIDDSKIINGNKYTLSGNVYISPSGTNDGTESDFQLYCRLTYSDNTMEYFKTNINKTLYGKWQNVSVSFNRNAEKTVKQINITLSVHKTTKYFYGSQIMLEAGEMVSPWSPNPNEIFDGITTINRDGITIEMIDGEGSKGSSRVSYEGITTYDSNGNIKSWFSDEDAYIAELNVDNINNPYLIQSKPRSTNWYVGQNETGDGTGINASNKSNSIQSVLEYIKNNYGCYSYRQDIKIYCDSGCNLNENIIVSGWMGSGAIEICFGVNSTFTGWIRVEECTPTVILNGEGTGWSNNDGCIWYRTDGNAEDAAFYVRSSNVICKGFRAHRGVGLTTYGNDFAYVNYNSLVILSNNDLVKYSSICRVTKGSKIYIESMRGDVDILCCSLKSSFLCARDKLPLFNTGNNVTDYYNSLKYNDGTDGNNSLWMPKKITTTDPEPTQPSKSWHWVEKTFYFNLSSTTEGSGSTTSGWTNKWGQGKWGNYKAHRGHAKPTESISSWCNIGSNTRNITMTLTMTRLSTGHGYYGAVPVPKIKQKDGTYWDSGVAFALGDKKSISLSSGIVSGLSDGALSELTMWAGSSSSDYSQYNSVSLKVKCEKYY